MTDGKLSDGGWSWNEADSLDAHGLTGSKFSESDVGWSWSDGGWSWNEADTLDALGLIDGKFSDCSWR